MARPSKQGLQYFPFDVDFFSDEKLNAISWEFGIKGEITTIKLLCAVYRNGYFIEWNEMLKIKLLKELPGISTELIDQIIKRLVKWDFFDKGLFDSASILTSRGIQRRYLEICSKTRRRKIISEYSLLESPSTTDKDDTADKINPIRSISQAPFPPESPSLPRPSVDEYSASFADEVERMKNDSQWIEQGICIKYNIDKSKVADLLQIFLAHCISECDAKGHKSYSDARRHFGNWYRTGYSIQKNQSKLNDKSASSSVDYSFSGGFGGQDV